VPLSGERPDVWLSPSSPVAYRDFRKLYLSRIDSQPLPPVEISDTTNLTDGKLTTEPVLAGMVLDAPVSSELGKMKVNDVSVCYITF
jgi:hypothetical protein